MTPKQESQTPNICSILALESGDTRPGSGVLSLGGLLCH
jgi:hypothetical protein